MRYHPDICDLPNDTEIMQCINAEYSEAFERLKNVFKGKDGNVYENDTQYDEVAEDFMNIINAIITLDGINVELLGRWIWVTGNSKPHKDVLKGLGFKWCKNKVAWSWHKTENRTFSRGQFTMDEIRSKYKPKNYNAKPATNYLTA